MNQALVTSKMALVGLLVASCAIAGGCSPSEPNDEQKQHVAQVEELVKEMRQLIDENNDKLSEFMWECMETLQSEEKLNKYLANLEKLVVSRAYDRVMALNNVRTSLESRPDLANAKQSIEAAFSEATKAWNEDKSEEWIKQVAQEDQAAINHFLEQADELLKAELEQLVSMAVAKAPEGDDN